MANDLLPCPFCGGEAETDYSRGYARYPSGKPGTAVAIYCLSCAADMTLCREDHRGVDAETLMAELIAAWNRRALPAAPQPEAEPVAWRYRDPGEDWRLSDDGPWMAYRKSKVDCEVQPLYAHPPSAEIERLTRECDEWKEAAGAHHVASMKEAEKWIAVSADRDELRKELAKTLMQVGELRIALSSAEAERDAALAQVGAGWSTRTAPDPAEQADHDLALYLAAKAEGRAEGLREAARLMEQDASDVSVRLDLQRHKSLSDWLREQRVSAILALIPATPEASPRQDTAAEKRRKHMAHMDDKAATDNRISPDPAVNAGEG